MAKQATVQEKETVQKQALVQNQQKAEVENKQKAEAETKSKAEAEKAAAAKTEAEKKASAEAAKKAEEAKKLEAENKKKAEEAAKKAEAEKAQKQAAHAKQLEKLTQELEQFSVTLNKKHFEAAVQVRDEIKQAGFEEPKFLVHTTAVYKKSFTFPQIANNDYAVEQFEALSIAEQNLNNDPTNDTAFENFTKAADECAHNLSERYKEQWVDPKDDRNKELA